MKNIFFPILVLSLSTLVACSSLSDSESPVTNNSSIQVKAINSIEITAEDTDLNIVKSDDSKIDYNPDFFVEGRNLICENKEGKLILTCLKKKKLDKYKDKSCVNVFINSKDILSDCKINMKVGDLKISEDVNLGDKLEINCDVGNVNLLGCNFLNSKLHVGTGNLEVSGELSGENNISVNTGNAALILKEGEKINDINYKFKTNVGKIFIDGNSAFKENSNGTFNIGHQLSNNVESDIKLDVNVNVGNISVNSKIKD